jgi:ATP adenylyltransferase
MDYLWTPWRYHYVTATESSTECVFCAAATGGDDEKNLIVHRAEHSFVILNRYPYTSGHVMVVPYAHIASLVSLPDHTLVEMIGLVRDVERHLRTLYRPEGINVGINMGRSAGAGIASHLHIHALPRWAGDTNFMSVVGETRVLPEDLNVTWENFRRAFAAGT